MKLVKPEENSTIEEEDLTEALKELARKHRERAEELTHDN